MSTQFTQFFLADSLHPALFVVVDTCCVLSTEATVPLPNHNSGNSLMRHGPKLAYRSYSTIPTQSYV